MVTRLNPLVIVGVGPGTQVVAGERERSRSWPCVGEGVFYALGHGRRWQARGGELSPPGVGEGVETAR